MRANALPSLRENFLGIKDKNPSKVDKKPTNLDKFPNENPAHSGKHAAAMPNFPEEELRKSLLSGDKGNPPYPPLTGGQEKNPLYRGRRRLFIPPCQGGVGGGWFSSRGRASWEGAISRLGILLVIPPFAGMTALCEHC